jgi:alpha-D-ribose 1-methylphosphonate 5-triphosphate synthase subunit PhnG
MVREPQLVDSPASSTNAGHVDDGSLQAARQATARAVALAGLEAAEHAFEALGRLPVFQHVRPPEIGLMMVRGRMGGAGSAFNLGEMTVTRAAVRLSSGEVGIGHVGGRSRRHAELAALADAMAQSDEWADVLQRHIVAPLKAVHDARRQSRGRKAAATQVEFFTLVRTRGAA